MWFFILSSPFRFIQGCHGEANEVYQETKPHMAYSNMKVTKYLKEVGVCVEMSVYNVG